MKEFDSYAYFRYLTNYQSSLQPSHLMKLVELTMGNQSIRLLEIIKIMGKSENAEKSWSYSDFLRFLYPTSE